MSDAVRLVARAADFAARRHSGQTRKDGRTPYINHLAEVAALVAATPSGGNAELVAAAYLHDVVEDGHATPEELEAQFGPRMRDLVGELTDDMSLAPDERKRRQVDDILHKSAEARLLKLADKVSNLREMLEHPPPDWPPAKRRDYAAWAQDVVDAGCRGLDPQLEAEFDRLAAELLRLA
jgi:(p)ppGpp synthase/HD superfamily hydrolase